MSVPPKSWKVVMAFWTFDLFHPGHRDYLDQAKEKWEVLIVVVALDQTVCEVKGKYPKENENQRLQKVSEYPPVDRAVLWSAGDYYSIIDTYAPDILFFWYDQKSFNDEKLTRYLQSIQLKPDIIIWKPFESDKWKSSLITR